MAVRHSEIVAGNRAGGALVCLLGIVALVDLTLPKDQACH
jgi:hypothetical protein